MSVPTKILELLNRFRQLGGAGRLAGGITEVALVARRYVTAASGEEARWLFKLPANKVEEFFTHWAGRNGFGSNVQRAFDVNPATLRNLPETITEAGRVRAGIVEGGLRWRTAADDFASTYHTHFAMVREGDRVWIDMAFASPLGAGASMTRSSLMSYLAQRIAAVGGEGLSPNLLNLMGGLGQTFRAVR
jgi:hypothetical protein